jgi:hypothetical protein
LRRQRAGGIDLLRVKRFDAVLLDCQLAGDRHFVVRSTAALAVCLQLPGCRCLICREAQRRVGRSTRSSMPEQTGEIRRLAAALRAGVGAVRAKAPGFGAYDTLTAPRA